jgi:hypothetical protein
MSQELSAAPSRLAHVFETIDGVDDLDTAAALAAAADLRRGADRAEAELLAVAAHWADLHAATVGEGVRHPVPGMEQVVPLAGEGTPEVAEFAPAWGCRRMRRGVSSVTRWSCGTGCRSCGRG